jgi:O-antigen/teichoic acid export membrane protein
MGTIRKQSIISSVVIYIGFGVGLLNTYFFTKEGLFEATEYGLTSIFIAIATMMNALAGMAMPAYVFKFYHYYNDHLPPRNNDMLSWSLLIGTVGFILVTAGGLLFKDLVIRKFGENSPLLLTYYYWIFPLGFGLTMYSILEVYAWNIGKSIFTNFLKEVQWRLFTTVLIVLLLTGAIRNFDLFIKLYAFTYPGIALILFCYLIFTGKVHFTFKISKVSRRYFRKIRSFCLFVYAGTLVFTLSQVFDSIVIASVLQDGLSKAGIFGLSQIMTSVIQAPQRAIIAATIPHLSRAWKDKDRDRLQSIYQRSSINQLIFAMAIFFLVVLNYSEAILTFKLKDVYLMGFNAFIFLGLTKVVDMGSGVNGQIISTSNYWRFELTSGVILLAIMLPLTILLAKRYDIMGPAIANLISITIYNGIRIIFLWRKFRLFPFTKHTLYTIFLATGCYIVCYYLFKGLHGFGGLVARSAAFILIYGGVVIYTKLTPDIIPVIGSIKRRLGLVKNNE